jgi:DNA-binding GntR family transcriptional regulator
MAKHIIFRMGCIFLRKDLRQLAYEYLVNAMTNFDILPGEAIVEQDISNRLNISRTPVREALKQLEADGLVYHIRQKGTFFSGVTNNDIEEIFELRLILESAAIDYAVKNLDDETLSNIRQDIINLGTNTNIEDYFELDRNLHQRIVYSMHNFRISRVFDQLSKQIGYLRRLSSRTPDRLVRSQQEHLNIINAIIARDSELARQYMILHLKNMKENTLKVNQNRSQSNGSPDSPFRSFYSVLS